MYSPHEDSPVAQGQRVRVKRLLLLEPDVGENHSEGRVGAGHPLTEMVRRRLPELGPETRLGEDEEN